MLLSTCFDNKYVSARILSSLQLTQPYVAFISYNVNYDNYFMNIYNINAMISCIP